MLVFVCWAKNIIQLCVCVCVWAFSILFYCADMLIVATSSVSSYHALSHCCTFMLWRIVALVHCAFVLWSINSKHLNINYWTPFSVL